MEKRYRINAAVIRADAEHYQYAFQFAEPLYRYLQRRRTTTSLPWRRSSSSACRLFVIMLRTESVLYFQFNKGLYLYSIVAATFLLSRYLFGALYKPVPIDPTFHPSITVIIPAITKKNGSAGRS